MNHVRPFFGAALFGTGLGLGIATNNYYTLWKRIYRGDFGSNKIIRKDDLTYSYHLIEKEDGFFQHKVTILRCDDPMEVKQYSQYGDLPGYITGSPHLHYEEIKSIEPIQVDITRRKNHEQYIKDLLDAVEACPSNASDEIMDAAIFEVIKNYKKISAEGVIQTL